MSGFSAYALSFATVGIIWINHHAQFARIAFVNAHAGLALCAIGGLYSPAPGRWEV